MGWWKTDETGKSFAPRGELTWGDIPADRMGEIMDEFAIVCGRHPTLEEIVAGYRFSIGRKTVAEARAEARVRRTPLRHRGKQKAKTRAVAKPYTKLKPKAGSHGKK